MRKLILASLLAGLAAPLPAAQFQLARAVQPMPSPAIRAQRLAVLSPSLRDWVSTRARAVVDSDAPPDPGQLAQDAEARLAGQAYSTADINELVLLVMMEAASQADADLRELMAQQKAANERKAAMREQVKARNAASAEAKKAMQDSMATSRVTCVTAPCPPQVTVAQPRIELAQPRMDVAKAPIMQAPPRSVQDAADSAKDEKDSLSEMGQADSMQLQLAMDRKAKLEEALSNVMKKSSDTASTITSNLK